MQTSQVCIECEHFVQVDLTDKEAFADVFASDEYAHTQLILCMTFVQFVRVRIRQTLTYSTCNL